MESTYYLQSQPNYIFISVAHSKHQEHEVPRGVPFVVPLGCHGGIPFYDHFAWYFAIVVTSDSIKYMICDALDKIYESHVLKGI